MAGVSGKFGEEHESSNLPINNDSESSLSPGEGPRERLSAGRLAMIILTILGTVPVFLGPEILSATTVSGAMVMGLGPVFCLWAIKAPPLSFYLSVGFGLLCGILLVLNIWPDALLFTEGKYADLLSVTVIEFVGCLVLYFAGLFLNGGSLKTIDHE